MTGNTASTRTLITGELGSIHRRGDDGDHEGQERLREARLGVK